MLLAWVPGFVMVMLTDVPSRETLYTLQAGDAQNSQLILPYSGVLIAPLFTPL
jgi:hypothetical protein